AKRGSRFCRSGIHGARARAGRCGCRDSPGSRQAPPGQARLCAAATALGGGALLWLGGSLSALGPRLRTLGDNTGWLPLARLCLAHAEKCVRTKLITGSSLVIIGQR